MTRRLLAALLLALAACPAATAAPPRRSVTGNGVPFACSTVAWDRLFTLTAVRYDKAAQRITWTLEARADAPLPAYEAFVADGDNVEVDTIRVRFTPAPAKVKAGKRYQAVLTIGRGAAGDPARITIRERR